MKKFFATFYDAAGDKVLKGSAVLTEKQVESLRNYLHYIHREWGLSPLKFPGGQISYAHPSRILARMTFVEITDEEIATIKKFKLMGPFLEAGFVKPFDENTWK